MDNLKQKYEQFHKNTRPLNLIPKNDNFALIHHMGIYKKYLKKNLRVLDIGCGAGAMSFYAASRGCEVLGIDISQIATKANLSAKDEIGLKNINFKCLDFPNIELEAKFDIVIMNEVLEHLPDDKMAVWQIYHLLREKGILLMSVPSQNAPLHRLKKKLYKKDNFDLEVGHLRRYTMDKIVKILENHSFAIVEKKKCEGILRNYLFIGKYGKYLMKLNRGFIKNIVTFLDNLLVPVFAESMIIIVARKEK